MNPTHRGILVLVGAVLVHITLGVLYSFGNFSPYLVSYLRARTSFTSVRYATISWIVTLMVMGQGSTMILGGLLERRVGTRLTIVTGCCVLTLATILSYFSIHSFYSLVFTYGILFGCGIGFAYSPAMTVSMKWLPTYKGVVAGSVVAGFGLGAMVFNPVITVYINPNNTSPTYAPYPSKPDEKYFNDPADEALLNNVPSCFLVMAGFFAGLQIIGILLIKPPPAELYEELSNSASVDSRMIQESESLIDEEDGISRDASPLELLRKPDFWCLWLGFVCNVQGVNYCSVIWKEFGQHFIDNDLFLAGIGSAGSVANAASRIMWGALGDTFSFKKAMLVLQFLFALLYLVMFYTQHFGKWGYAVFICLLFACIGGSFSLYPTVVVKTYGPTHSTANYGLLFTSSVVGAIINVILFNEIETRISDQHMQWLVAAFLLCGFVCTSMFQVIGPLIRRNRSA